jgi:hypothetical protein
MERDNLEDLSIDGKVILIRVLNKQNGIFEMESCVLGQEPVMCYCEKGNRHNFIKHGKASRRTRSLVPGVTN